MFLTDILVRLFVRDRQNVTDPLVRRRYGTMVSLVGIVLNFLLCAGKFIAGSLLGSISVVADAVNNLSDAGSQVVSLVSFRISAKPADRDHPYGHARIEYVASMIVSFLILIVGYELFTDSLDKVLHPETLSRSFPLFTVVMLSASILVKFWMFLFNRKIGSRISSEVMRASAADSISDVCTTFAVLIATLIFTFTGVNLDGWMGMAVAVFIFIAGLKILNESKNSILGEAPSKEVSDCIISLVMKYPEAIGIHDLVLHNYGPNCYMATFHVEVDGSKNIFETHDAIDNMERELWDAYRIRATIHMDPIVTDDEAVSAMREAALRAARSVGENFRIHDFRAVIGETHSNLIFDVAVPFEDKRENSEISRLIDAAVKAEHGNWYAVTTIDRC